MTVRVIVAAHKKAPMPADPLYLPLHVGAAGKESIGFRRDDEGENISLKNSRFSELTGLYWAWKNLDADCIGLVHYRRFFKGKGRGRDPLAAVLTEEEALALLADGKPVLPKKRNYLIDTLYGHYCHTLSPGPLDLTGEIIRASYPRYAPEFERLKTRRAGHMFNMMIMPRDILDRYCAFLFPLLFEVEEKADPAEFEDPFHARFPGRVSELLLDVFLRTEGIDCREVPLLYPDGQGLIKKGAAFLRARFGGKKYGKSF
ncbi:MAG: DUF4422 domain-containing protein [Clostridia bacterium]|nr:DUF4422 domain-containing protein [Clostridia bacterium]